MNTASEKILANVSRETLAKLEDYVALLEKWNRTINLIGKSTLNEIWRRHIEDSLQVAEQIASAPYHADMGSGGGLPGIVIAICHPEMACHLIEQDSRKAAFLQECAARLHLENITIINKNIEAVEDAYNVITARALASLSDLCALAYPRLAKDAFCLFPKGRNLAIELEEASRHWTFTHRSIPSKTEEEATILRIDHLSPRKGSI